MKKSKLFYFFTLFCVKFYFINANGIEQLRKNPREMTQTSNVVSQGLSYLHFDNFDDAAVYTSNAETIIPKIDETVSDGIAFNVLSFAHDMGTLLNNAEYSSKSEIYSPVSIMASLAFLLLGSKGKSYQELSNAFGLNYKEKSYNYPGKFHKEFGQMLEDIEKKNSVYRSNTKWRNTQRNNIRNFSKNKAPTDHIIKMSNGLFIQKDYSINHDFRQVMNLVYHSHLQLLDFRRYPEEAKDTINSWISQNTYEKIKSIVNENFHKSINVIIASTLYFKAFWENSFFESATTTDFFYPDGIDNPPINIKMMATGGVFPFYDSLEYKCRIIGLPYKGNLTTMYVIQPHYSSRNNLRELQKLLDANKIEELISKMTQKTAIMAFPKMHLTKSINMKNILNHFGIVEIFSRGISDLSLISATHNYLKSSSEPIQTLYSDTNVTPILKNRFPEERFIFSRISEAERIGSLQPSIPYASSKESRFKRQLNVSVSEDNKMYYINRLENERYATSNSKSDLYVEDIVHKVDFDVNEHGTEAAAATLTYLRRTGTDVLFRAETPFLILIRHDPTKLILFYGIINEPVL